MSCVLSILQQFYQNRIKDIFLVFKINSIISSILLILRHIFKFSLILVPSLINKLNIDYLYESTENIRSLSSISSHASIIFYGTLVMNISVVFYLVMQLIFFNHYPSLQDHVKSTKMIFIEYLFSFILQSNTYIIFIPCVFYSMTYQNESYLYLLNIFLVLLISNLLFTSLLVRRWDQYLIVKRTKISPKSIEMRF